MITVEQIKVELGWPLTNSEARIQATWDDSPEYPVAVEQALPIAVSRVTPALVNLVWSPESGSSAIANVWIDVLATGVSWIHHYTVDWGDGFFDTYPGHGLPRFHFQTSHRYTSDVASVIVRAYDGGGILIESRTLTLSYTRSSYWRVGQYRIERFKGRFQYAEQGRRWLQDWSPIPISMDFNIEATDRWNWGFRLWLREIDNQSRPELIMVPSTWAATGTGEGSIPLPVLTGWGSEWGSMWGST